MHSIPDLPDWAAYTVTVDPDIAPAIVAGGARIPLRLADLGAGRIVLDIEAVAAMGAWPEDANGCITADEDGLTMWISGVGHAVCRITSTPPAGEPTNWPH